VLPAKLARQAALAQLAQRKQPEREMHPDQKPSTAEDSEEVQGYAAKLLHGVISFRESPRLTRAAAFGKTLIKPSCD
jgi:hypothetical protein